MSQRCQRLTGVLSGLMLMILSLGAAPELRAEAPSIVRQIPDEAQAFIAVPSLSGLSEELAGFNERSGIEHPRLSDVLGQIKSMGNIRQGLNDDGGAAFVLLSAPLPEPGQQDQAGQRSQPEGVLLLPVSDYAAFLENFGLDDAAEDEPVRIEMQGRPAFVKPTGDYAVLSNLHSVTESFELPEENGLPEHVGQFGEETLTESDLLLYLNMAELGPRLQPMVEMGLSRARQRMRQQNSDAAGPDQRAVQEAIIDLYAGALKTFLRDARATVTGLDLAEDGVGLTSATQFKPDSPLGEALADAPAEPVSFDRLPDRSYMLASSVNLEALPLRRWFGQAIETLPEDNPFASVFRSSLQLMEQMGGEAQQAWYLPEGGAGGPGELFHGVSVYDAPDPEQLRQTYRQVLEDLDALEVGPQTGYSAEYEEDVMEVADRQVDRYNLQFKMSPEQRQQLGPMVALLGQGISGYLVTTDNTLIVTNGGDPSLIKAAIEAAENDGNLEENLGIGETRTGLPGDRVAEVYLDVGSVMQMGRSLVALFAPEKQIEVPADLPPVAASASVRESGIAGRLYVPMRVISALTDAAKQLQGNGGPSGNGEPNASRNSPDDGVLEQRSDALLRFDEAGFDQEVVEASRTRPVVVELWAPWSDPSQKQMAVLNTLAERYKGRVRIGTVNIDDQPRVGQSYQIEQVPMTLVLKDGEVADRFAGLTPERELTEAIEAALSK